MSNLITPMITSVDNSPVEFYPSPIRCTIINNKADHALCLNDASKWDDLEHLVSHSPYNTSTPVKSKNVYNRNVFNNNSSFTNQNAITYETSKITKNDKQICETDINKSGNIPWNRSKVDNNSCSKACVNINMGYNEGSSIESMVGGKFRKETKEIGSICEQPSETTVGVVSNKPPPSMDPPSADTAKFLSSAVPFSTDLTQVKTFKNGAKTGHSRQWGSCGSAGTLRLNNLEMGVSTSNKLAGLEHRMLGDKSSNSAAQFSVATTAAVAVTSGTTTAASPNVGGSDSRSTYFTDSNTLKRISQVSFEAEFDSEGRIHEQTNLNLRKIDPYILAGQITVIELSFFKAMKSEEFLSFKWTGHLKQLLAPGIVASTKWFNQLNFWAQRMILECQELNKRADMLAYFIRVLKKLVDNFNNLSSGMAVMSALQVECIHRLRQTWTGISSRDKTTFKRMEELFSGDNNYENLRSHITSLKLPCIPYIGLYLSDLTYINTAHAKHSEFESQTKTDQINNILRVISEFQQSEYEISNNKVILRYLESQRYIEELQKIIEDSNYRTSVSLEPPSYNDSFCGASSVAGAAVVGAACVGAGTAASSCATGAATDASVAATSGVGAAAESTGPGGRLLNVPHDFSPQKTPPSFTCQHGSALQSPISPLPLVAVPTSLSVEPHPETEDTRPTAAASADAATAKSSNTNHNETVATSPAQHEAGRQQTPVGDNTSSTDSLQPSFLCGTGKKSIRKNKQSKTLPRQKSSSQHSEQKHKHNHRSPSADHKRQSSSTTATAGGAVAAAATCTGSGATGNKNIDCSSAKHSMSLLDDSFLDATLNTLGGGVGTADDSALCGGGTGVGSLLPPDHKMHHHKYIPSAATIANTDSAGHPASSCTSSAMPRKQTLLTSLPIIKCKIKKNSFDLKPKASSKQQTELLNLVNVANAARYAADLSRADTLTSGEALSSSVVVSPSGHRHRQSQRSRRTQVLEDEDEEDLNEEDEDDEDEETGLDSDNTGFRDTLHLLCQGPVSRKTLVRSGGKKSFISMWKRYWVMLLRAVPSFASSGNRDDPDKTIINAAVNPEPSQSQAASTTAAYLIYFEGSSSSKKSLERRHFKQDKCYVQDLREAALSIQDPRKSGQTSSSVGSGQLDSFFLSDREYGTVYKFKSVSGTSLSSWYHGLIEVINQLNVHRNDSNRDLIVLVDS